MINFTCWFNAGDGQSNSDDRFTLIFIKSTSKKSTSMDKKITNTAQSKWMQSSRLSKVTENHYLLGHTPDVTAISSTAISES